MGELKRSRSRSRSRSGSKCRKKPAKRSRSRRGQKKRKAKETRKGGRAGDIPHFQWKRGMALGKEGRYTIEDHLGDGTFGRVLACIDQRTKQRVAVKVVKGVKRFCEHAEAEAEVLSDILQKDMYRQAHIVDMRGAFLHDECHYCIVFEPLSTSLRDFLKANRSLGMMMANVWEVSRQLLKSLAFLHALGVTHTDLKCRNVMLRDSAYDLLQHPREDGEVRRLRNSDIALIDFGGAVFPDERHGGRIGTRQFRAPEVVIGLSWDETSDLWSAGCIVAMLYLGERPFSVHEDMEHLAMMEKVLDLAFPAEMIHTASKAGVLPDGIHCDDACRLLWPSHAEDDEAVERVSTLRPLRKRICDRHAAFHDDVLLGLMEIDPSKRVGAGNLLRHSFFAQCDLPE